MGDECSDFIVHQPCHLRCDGLVGRDTRKCFQPGNRHEDVDIDVVPIQEIEPRFQVDKRWLQSYCLADRGRASLLLLQLIEKFQR